MDFIPKIAGESYEEYCVRAVDAGYSPAEQSAWEAAAPTVIADEDGIAPPTVVDAVVEEDVVPEVVAEALEATEVATTTSEVTSDGTRRGRGALEADVHDVLVDAVEGRLADFGTKPLTPHRIGRILTTERGLEKAPSTGAISRTLGNWAKLGYIEISESPVAFKAFGTTGKSLVELKAAAKAEAKAAKPPAGAV